MNYQQAASVLYGKSRRNLKLAIVCSAVLFAMSIASLFFKEPLTDGILILIVISLQVAQLYLKYRSLTWAGWGDEARRVDLLQVGLGHHPYPPLAAKIGRLAGQCSKPIDAEYYRTRSPNGPRKLVEMTLESAYYSEGLAGSCASLFRIIGIAGLVFAVSALIFALRVSADNGLSENVARILIGIFAFFLTSDFWTLAAQYKDFQCVADESLSRAYELARTDVTLGDALELVLRYNTSAAQSPPLLSWFHNRTKNEKDAHFEAFFE